MLSKADLRDFVEINRGLYGEDASTTALIDMFNRAITPPEPEQHQRHGAERS
jgi:hypothetical protein